MKTRKKPVGGKDIRRRRASKELAKKRVADIAVERVLKLLREDGYICVIISTPAQAKAAGFGRWPGFDVYACKKGVDGRRDVEKYVEIKGRARKGGVRITKNEWRAAGEYRGYYYLYIVYNCFSVPEIVYVRNPANKLPVVKRKGRLFAADEDIERVGKKAKRFK